MLPNTAVVEVRFSDCDPMGHVNNANYLTYFEQGRVEFLRQNHLGWSLPFIIAEAHVRFVAPAQFAEFVYVHVQVVKIGQKSWRFAYRATDESGQRLFAEGWTAQVAFDYTTHKSMAIPEDFRAVLERWLVPSEA